MPISLEEVKAGQVPPGSRPVRQVAEAAAEWAALEESRQRAAERLDARLGEMADAASSVVELWKGLCVSAAKGEADLVQSRRDWLVQHAGTTLASARELARIADEAKRAGMELGCAERLVQEADKLERFILDVFPRWSSRDDLLALACEWFPLGRERLAELARRPLPTEWLDQDDKPW